MSDLSQYRGKRTRNKQKYLRKRRRRVFIWTAAILLILIAAGAAVFSLYGFDISKLPFMRQSNAAAALKQPQERVTALVVGVKDSAVGEEAVSFAVATYSPTTKILDVISIPTATMVEIPGHGVGDIKQAYTLGKIALTESSVEYLTGIKINHYIKVTDKGFVKIVDAMGGVVLNGKNSTGKAAEEFLAATSKDEKELPRIERQNNLVLALQKKTNGDAVFGRLPSIVKSIQGDYDSDFSATQATDLVQVLASLQPAAVKAQTLPIKEVVVNLRVFYQPEKTAVDALIARVFPELAKSGKANDIKVRVLNGVGDPGIASDLAKLLNDNSYRVVDTKNADNFDYAETQILIYSNTARATNAAAKVKTLLGLGKTVVNSLPQDVADVTIIVGRDYADKVRQYTLLKTVEVLNGTDRAGFAATIGDKLTSAGYNVVNTGNADRTDYAATEIIVFVNNSQVKQMADDIAKLLGAGGVKIAATGRTDIEVSVILGKDL